MELIPGTTVLQRGRGTLQVGSDDSRHVTINGLELSQIRWLTEYAASVRPLSRLGTPSRHVTPPYIPHSIRIEARLMSAGFITAPKERAPLTIRCEGINLAVIVFLEMLSQEFTLNVDFRNCGIVDAELSQYLGLTHYGTRADTAVRHRFELNNLDVRITREEHPDLVVIGAERFVSSSLIHTLMNTDIPHFVVARVESGYEVGPLVLPGHTPCIQCLTLHRIDSNPYLIGHRQQLSHWPLAPVQGVMHCLAAAKAARRVWELMLGLCSPRALAAVDMVTGDEAPAAFHVRSHPSCTCGGELLPEIP